MPGTRLLRLITVWLALIGAFARHTRGQEVATPSGEKSAENGPPASALLPEVPSVKSDVAATHPFWDKRNAWLFAGVGASRALDYASTLNMRRRGRSEILLTNDVVDNHAAFAAIEAAGAGVSICASYLFHRYRHHRLERWTSIVHIGVATGGAIRNYSLKTAHKNPATP